MKRYALVQSELDRSGIIRVIGPYNTEEDARGDLPEIQDFLVDSYGHWDVVPVYNLKGLFE